MTIIQTAKTLIHDTLRRNRRALVYLGRDEHEAVLACQSLARERAIAGIIKKSDVNLVIDVGANVGQFASGLRMLGYRGRIVSFEPEPSAFEQLKRTSSGDADWQQHRLALGSAPGSASLQVFSESTELSTLRQHSDGMSALLGQSPRVSRLETVPVETLNALWSQIAGDIVQPRCFLKIDTQGSDPAVLAGASTVLPKVVALMTEVSVRPIYKDVPPWHETISSLHEDGWKLLGLYPCAHERKTGAVMEFDCLMGR
jgi:FkbM family methyltransferase